MIKVKQHDEETIEVVKGDGGDASVTDDELTRLKNEIDHIMKDAAEDIADRRSDASDARFCRWTGQSSDGLVHRKNLDGEPVFPFEGAPDTRIRTADMLVNERAKTLVAAATRSRVVVEGTESRDLRLGAVLTVVLKWLLKSKLGSSWRRTLERLAQWQEGDVPAGAVMGVYWQAKTALENKEIGIDDVAQLLMASGIVPAEDPEALVTELVSMLQDPEQEERLAGLLTGAAPHVTMKRARKIAKDLRKNFVVDEATGQPATSAVFPQPYMKENGPALTAHRLFEDIFIPANTTDIQRSRAVFIREWLSEAEMRERVLTHGYSREYVEKALEYEGETGFPTYEITELVEDALVVKSPDTQARRGLYEQITAYYKAVNDDGVPGVYYTCFHSQVDFAAKDRQLLPYAHGEYPFVWFGRETLTSRLWDSRSVPELAMTMQKLQKVFWDSFGAHVQLTTVPPIKAPKSRPTHRVAIGPMAVVKETRPNEINWMAPPAYPTTNDKARADLDRMVDNYFGRMNRGTTDPALTQLHQQDMIDRFLDSLKDVFKMVLQLCQQYMDDQTLARITGAKEAVPIARGRAEIQGMFDVSIDFDAKDLDMEHVIKKAEIIGRYILPMDTLGTAKRDLLVARLFGGIDPNLADDVLVPVEAANQKEISEEQINFAKIAAGVEPDMKKEGENHALRLQVLQAIGQANPAAMENLTEDSQKILQNRVKHLQFMQQQQQNKQIGRVGTSPAQMQQQAPQAGLAGGGEPGE